MASSGPTDDEVARAKQRMVAQAVFARDSYSTAAHIIGEGLATGQTLADIEAWPERIQAVSRDQVAEAARLVLNGPGVTSLLLSAGNGAEQAAEAPPPMPQTRSPSGGAIR